MQFYKKFLDIFDFMSFFAWTFLNFLARCVIADLFTCMAMTMYILFGVPFIGSSGGSGGMFFRFFDRESI